MFLIASDHGGLELKEQVKAYLKQRNIEVRDLGTDNGDSVDYPDFGERVGRAISTGEAEKGILICGTGIGMSIVANKFPGVRAALIWDEFTARMSKEHNNANIIVMGGRMLSDDKASQMVGVWLDATFEGGRHQKRLDKIAQIEEDIRSGRL
ncbi:ribose-5-phosphate isomerase B [Syntrophotalea carbinolica DSM 2380]|uniref:Ribose-5-phosphate isomerase B n=1 Tax=Syntrophotalea carbinolica (strain DSM 2380 / NBRC 103641 / GraBd1) TaxID=338963 RepID=Q3A4M0_SYNC1|nr:ribose 5-phosphate isomerase B [Syntrophotalea carbinolica]ABA88687.1 ribose-5-phosphate isomerase B [Syntrophotalea carbinolica DSM 2380]